MSDLLMIAAITVFVVDLSGIVESIKAGLSRWLGTRVVRLKPLDCSLCMVWWVCLAWIVFTGHFDIWHILVCAMLSFFADTIRGAMILIKEIITKGIDIIYKKLKI